MPNTLTFDEFLNTLQTTNRSLDFFIDWDKCLQNRNAISICLNHLNFLLGKNQHEMQNCINKLFTEYLKAFEVLYILIAIRNKKEMVIDANSNLCTLETYFQNADKVCNVIYESGLHEVFSNRQIKDLNDFVFSVEVGLDSNARKNRSGNAMEYHLNSLFAKSNLNFKRQVSIDNFTTLHQSFGADIKKFDFVVYGTQITYFIESNFYASGGSKLNEVARAYQELALKFKYFPFYKFIWITDGQGWLSAKNKLQEAYKFVEIYNLSNLDDFIQKVSNGNAE